MKLPLNPNIELFRWGPVPGRYFFDSIFTYPYTVLNKRYGKIMWPAGLFLCNNGQMLYANENPRVVEYGIRAFQEYVLDAKEYKEVYGAWRNAAGDLTQFNNQIGTTKLSDLSNADLASVWKKIREILTEFWVPGLLLELANYGSPELLKQKLAAHITNEAELTRAMELLTSPEVTSFYQDEEIELSETTNLAEHQQKWFWLKNSYFATEVADEEFFAKRKTDLPSDLKQKIAERIANIKRQKNQLIRHYHLRAEVVTIANAVWQGLAWQDERKKHIFINLHYNHLLLIEIAHRFGFEADDLLNIGVEEITDLLDGKDMQTIVQTRRNHPFGFYMRTTLDVLTDSDAEQFWELYSKDKVIDSEKLSGTVASRGPRPVIRGKVTILTDPSKADHFPHGNVLIAPMTSPEYIFAMKRASAIITDVGGLTSHAAITSRELGIPCIVGTKVATQILKDGDTVEVDANQGVVKILKRSDPSGYFG